MKEVAPVRLSHSSANLLRGCETKYVHYKVKETEKDSDFEENAEHFQIGKAVHAICENTLYEYEKESFEHWSKYCVEQYMVEEYKYMIQAMVFKLYKLHKKEGLHVIECEYKIETDVTLGYVDLIAGDDKGNWWIIDLKTTKQLYLPTVAKLAKDYQLNLYAAHIKEIAAEFKLDVKKFMGCRYRVVTKSTAKPRDGETLKSYITRNRGIKGYEVIIPKDLMDPATALRDHKRLQKRATALFKGSKPTCDYSYCNSFFRPCEYYSQCHDMEYSDAVEELEVHEY